MKIKIPSTLPIVKIPPKASIVIHLLYQEIKHQRFISFFEKAGLDPSARETDLSKLVLSLAGFENHTDELLDWYFEMLDDYAAKAIDSDGKHLHELAFNFYVDLEVEFRKTNSKRDEAL